MARLKKGMTQKELAAAAGMDEMTVVNWERYEGIPRGGRVRLKRVCDVLGLDIDEMVATFPWMASLR